jgi:predicted nucleotidyltransferase
LKDDAKLDDWIERGRWTPDEVAAIRAEGRRIGQELDRGRRWWFDDWAAWQPDPDWPKPTILETWVDPAPTSTGFPELDELLAELVARVSSILGDDLVGAYLTGSFALGGADRHSDCDFLVVAAERLTPEQERALRELHREIPTRSGYWPHNLEGSYAPAADLATLAALGERWLYVNRGHREMDWSTHCNTEDVRWTLRERGLTLAGPDPKELVAEVPAEALRSSTRPLIETFLPDLFTWISFDNAWAQRYAVATLCRMLYTVETGEVTSKPAALEWAKDALPPVWRDLIQQVLDDRDTDWDPAERPRAGSVAATTALAEYAKERAAAGAR